MPTSLTSRILVNALAVLVGFGLLLAVATPVDRADAAASGGIGSPGSEPSDDADGKTSGKYLQLWEKTSTGDRRWARKTARCESGGDPKAIGGGGAYRGAFQFLRSSWKNAPKSPGGDPIVHSYKTQAVVAIALKKQMGTSPWPVCG